MAKIAVFDTDKRVRRFFKKGFPKDKITFFDGALNINFDFSKIKDAEIVSFFGATSKGPKEVLSKIPNLKMIATRSTGYNHIDLKYCKKNQIEVCNVPRYGQNTVAEFAFGLLLNVIKKVSYSNSKLKQNECVIADTESLDLYGKTIGIIGTGSIGTAATRIAQGFGMKILAYDIFPNKDLEKQYDLKYVSFQQLLQKSDVISLHCPLTNDNKHLIDFDAFSIMKKSAILVNTARGGLVNTEALYQALIEGEISGVGLDVFESENAITFIDKPLEYFNNLDKNQLLDVTLNLKMMLMDNVVMTPHIAFNSKEANERILKTTIENIRNYKSGKVSNSVLKK
jgi:D-lactate dehydrogenase